MYVFFAYARAKKSEITFFSLHLKSIDHNVYSDVC